MYASPSGCDHHGNKQDAMNRTSKTFLRVRLSSWFLLSLLIVRLAPLAGTVSPQSLVSCPSWLRMPRQPFVLRTSRGPTTLSRWAWTLTVSGFHSFWNSWQIPDYCNWPYRVTEKSPLPSPPHLYCRCFRCYLKSWSCVAGVQSRGLSHDYFSILDRFCLLMHPNLALSAIFCQFCLFQTCLPTSPKTMPPSWFTIYFFSSPCTTAFHLSSSCHPCFAVIPVPCLGDTHAMLPLLVHTITVVWHFRPFLHVAQSPSTATLSSTVSIHHTKIELNVSLLSFFRESGCAGINQEP